MQTINRKQYNEYPIGGYFLLVPVYGKHGKFLIMGELKDILIKLNEFGKKAHEENKKRYVEVRTEYDQARTRLIKIRRQLNILSDNDDIDALETRRILTEEKQTLAGKIFRLREELDQLYHKDFVPEKPAIPTPPQQPEVQQQQETTYEKSAYEQTDGYKVRQLRALLGESQVQFAKRFHVAQNQVSRWETNRDKPPQEVLTWHPPAPASQTAH